MLLGGLWHGASWTFIFWGVYQGALLIIYRILDPVFKRSARFVRKVPSGLRFIIKVIFFYHLICIGWLIFRSRSVGQCFSMLQSLVFNFNILDGNFCMGGWIFYVLPLIIIQIFQYRHKDLLIVLKGPFLIRSIVYFIIMILIIIFGVTGGKEFIYFQF